MGPRDESAAFLVAFGRAVRQCREKKEISQEELGFQADLDRTYISGIERGLRNPTLKTIRRIAKALGTRPSRLIGMAEEEG